VRCRLFQRRNRQVVMKPGMSSKIRLIRYYTRIAVNGYKYQWDNNIGVPYLLRAGSRQLNIGVNGVSCNANCHTKRKSSLFGSHGDILQAPGRPACSGLLGVITVPLPVPGACIILPARELPDHCPPPLSRPRIACSHRPRVIAPSEALFVPTFAPSRLTQL